ncbi:MAG: energy-coupling factor ABC transporter permease [bacterium]|nr:energy-coupling factor ABC transporter permease [bacterium]
MEPMRQARSLTGRALLGGCLFLISARQAGAMHIMEGFLPPEWCGFWFLAALPFWLAGYRRIKSIVARRQETLMLLGVAGAYIFVLSALKIPSVTGSCSHPTGTGLGVILFGPAVVSILSAIVLFFQALMLAHGGLTTLGANTVAMGIAGPLLGWLFWRILRRRAPEGVAVFMATMAADLSTYFVTAVQLAAAYPAREGGVGRSLVTFLGIFAVTQIPLALIEGFLTVLIVRSLGRNAPETLALLGVPETPSGAGEEAA